MVLAFSIGMQASLAMTAVSDICDTDAFKRDYKKVAGSYSDAKNKFISIATKLNCYPKADGNCKHNELVQPTADFQLALRNINEDYIIATSSHGSCYPELVGIYDSPFQKYDSGLEMAPLEER